MTGATSSPPTWPTARSAAWTRRLDGPRQSGRAALTRRIRPSAEDRAILDRMRGRLGGQPDLDEESPVIVRRERPASGANGVPRPTPIAVVPEVLPPLDASVGDDELEEEPPVGGAGTLPDGGAQGGGSARGTSPTLDLLADAPSRAPRRWTSRRGSASGDARRASASA